MLPMTRATAIQKPMGGVEGTRMSPVVNRSTTHERLTTGTNDTVSGDLLALVWRSVVGDAKEVVDTSRAESAGEDVGTAAFDWRTNDALERHMTVVDFNVDNRAALARSGPERRILFDLLRDDQLQLVVI